MIWTAAGAVASAQLAKIPHPRLWLPKGAETAVRDKIAADPLAAKLQAIVLSSADHILTSRTCRYEIPDGRRLLAESRLAVQNITYCAWAWRITGSEPYRLRAIAELEAACALKDWNPSHFLDTAEMSTAVAIGYDWLYETLTPEHRSMCERAIVEKALKPAKKSYDEGSFWTHPKNNWSQVCGSGIAIAAIAIAGQDEGLAEDLFTKSVKLVDGCEYFYQPEGMYPEGPGYWHYGTDYNVLLLSACETLGKPMPDHAVLQKSGVAILQLTSPTRVPFTFADSHPRAEAPTCAQSWLATHYKDSAQATATRKLYTLALEKDGKNFKVSNYLPLALLWLPPAPPAAEELPKTAFYHGEQALALFRTGWNPNDTWLGIKGGTPAASHSHMDVGSFVYDAHGIRWAQDLGSDDYNMPGYFGGQRWNYYRLQNRSHNTLEIGGKLQNPKSHPCPLTNFSNTSNSATATFDLTDAYSNSAKKVIRTATFDTRSGLTCIQDEIDEPSGPVVWRIMTDADCKILDGQVILSKNGKNITLTRISPGGTWSVTDAKPLTPQENQNEGIQSVELTVPKAKHISLSVEIRP